VVSKVLSFFFFFLWIYSYLTSSWRALRTSRMGVVGIILHDSQLIIGIAEVRSQLTSLLNNDLRFRMM